MLFDDFTQGIFGIEMRQDLYNPQEGLEHGNLFPELYKPYKNYNLLKILPKNEKEKLLLEIYAYDFAVNDLSLYLDVYPQDQKKYLLFKEYSLEYEKLKKTYERHYGPLSLTDVYAMNYVWYKNPWPWESGEAIYV